MPELTTTSATAIRSELIARIKRIEPRAPSRSADRWKWIGDRKRTNVEETRHLRSFDVQLGLPSPRPGFAYGGGVMYTVPVRICTKYPLIYEEMAALAGDDAQDLAALVVRLHAFVPGMEPADMGSQRAPLIEPVITKNEDKAYIVDFIIGPGLRFFGSDQVALRTE